MIERTKFADWANQNRLPWWDRVFADLFFERLKEIQARNEWIEDVKERLGLITMEDW